MLLYFKKKIFLKTSLLRWFFFFSFICLIQGIFAIYDYGYIGQDWGWHSGKILLYKTQGFSYANTNPPGFYVIGYLIEKLVGEKYLFETYSFLLLIINIFAIYLFALFFDKVLKSISLKVALLGLLFFTPFRVMHSLIISCDALTVLPFIFIILVSEKLFNPNSSSYEKIYAWIFTSIFMLIGLWIKFTFIGLIPVLLFIFFIHLSNYKQDFKVKIVACLAILAPIALFLCQMFWSYKAKSVTTHQHWDHRETSPDMNFRDLFFPKIRDFELLLGPDDTMDLRTNHRHSYMGLVHYSLFFDPQKFFQPLKVAWPKNFSQRNQSIRNAGIDSLENPERVRSKISTFLGPFALISSLPLSILILCSVPFLMFVSLTQIIKKKITTNIPPLLIGAILLSVAFHAIIFIPLPFIFNAYKAGYWTPRLIMPSILTYFVITFYLLEQYHIKNFFPQKLSILNYIFNSKLYNKLTIYKNTLIIIYIFCLVFIYILIL